MPMVKPWVPRKLQPWIYLLVAFGFQLGGGIYMGAMNEIVGEHALMREDVQMANFSTLCGMSLYFPLLFRMKFRFTNKQLLTAAALVMIVCNLVAPHVRYLPLLWGICFVGGMAKIQGTFECMSNIQLWMTPKRDFTVFFPCLQCMILCLMQVSDLLSVHLAYYYHWSHMHWFVVGYMLMVLLFVHLCVRPFRFTLLPLYGVDWLGWALWAVFSMEITYLFCYGEWLDWWNSAVFCKVVAAALVTLFCALRRMVVIRHPYYEPAMWGYRHLALVFILITLVEALLSAEYVLEEIFYEEVMLYPSIVAAQLDWVAIAGIVIGCVFSLLWMHVWRQNYIRLCSIGLLALACYMGSFYLLIDSNIYLWQLWIPILCRSFAYAVLCCAFFVWLNELMTFQHFFQSLSVFNWLHAVVGGVVGSAIYQRAFSYLMSYNMGRYGTDIDHLALSARPGMLRPLMEPLVTSVTEVSIKQIYGGLAYASLFMLLLFLLYDTPVRQTYKRIPSWSGVARGVKKSVYRLRHPIRAARGQGQKQPRTSAV